MNKVAEFLSKWAFAIVLCLIAVALCVAIGCGVFTAMTNLAVGLIGIGINVAILAFIVGWICVEIKEG